MGHGAGLARSCPVHLGYHLDPYVPGSQSAGGAPPTRTTDTQTGLDETWSSTELARRGTGYYLGNSSPARVLTLTYRFVILLVPSPQVAPFGLCLGIPPPIRQFVLMPRCACASVPVPFGRQRGRGRRANSLTQVHRFFLGAGTGSSGVGAVVGFVSSKAFLFAGALCEDCRVRVPRWLLQRGQHSAAGRREGVKG